MLYDRTGDRKQLKLSLQNLFSEKKKKEQMEQLRARVFFKFSYGNRTGIQDRSSQVVFRGPAPSSPTSPICDVVKPCMSTFKLVIFGYRFIMTELERKAEKLVNV